MNLLATGAILALSLGFAVPASAATITVKNISMDTSHTIGLTRMDSAAFTVYDNIQTLTTIENAIIDTLCVDTYHFDHLGGQDPLQVYQWGAITTDFGGNLLSTDQKGQLKYFASLIGTSGWNDVYHGGILQDATWYVEHDVPNFNGDTTRQNDVFSLVNDGHRIGGTLYGWVNLTDGQSLLGGGVPEPMTWALMTIGFGSMGAMLRRRRSLAFA